MQDLTPDELLTTTRTVRKRLDFERLYNQGLDDFIATFGEAGCPGASVPGADRIESSTAHLRENFHRAYRKPVAEVVRWNRFEGRT